MADVPAEIPMPDPTASLLKPFFDVNQSSSFRREGSDLTIVNPWNDESLLINVADGDADIVAVLNSVFLPPSFCAIYHLDTRDLECVYSGLPTDPHTYGRAFEIHYNGEVVKCEYAEASQRLIGLAEHVAFTNKPNQSDYRFIGRFMSWWNRAKRAPEELRKHFRPPTSFWVRNVPQDELYLVGLSSHMNFYMHYYDRQSPLVSVVEVANEKDAPRFQHGDFPSVINSRPMNSYMLALWQNCVTTDQFRRFIHSYQILEFASHYYVDQATHESIRKLLVAPNAVQEMDSTIRKVAEIMTLTGKDDLLKLKNVVKDFVRPETAWAVIESNRDAFTKETQFDGGLTFSPMLDPSINKFSMFADPKKDTWWSNKVVEGIDGLRNKFVHARERREPIGILPTNANAERLRPWGDLTFALAEDLLIYFKH